MGKAPHRSFSTVLSALDFDELKQRAFASGITSRTFRGCIDAV
jgi:hypothetical protein